ncbi:hypothetical protein EDC94DRAFT_584205 [Helicostylum pulchrum]|nr:hypothetical protein EDC94DRAFT_584205 [Helicostylum pulchrum]
MWPQIFRLWPLRKTFSKPLTGQLLTINEPRVSKEDTSQAAPSFEAMISDTPSKPTSIIKNEYNKNLEDQHTADSYKFDPTHSESDKKVIKLLKYIVNDYHANCEKPVYYTDANERTPMLRIYHTDIQIIQRHVQEPLVHVNIANPDMDVTEKPEFSRKINGVIGIVRVSLRDQS